ncbi:hypothetical protein [Aureibaculum conchae]|uniref:hypothetical protein n=1 Tax=Aureibaculum sp. 2308TA14-22 TaxID=3108392 RepID=UPI0033940627
MKKLHRTYSLLSVIMFFTVIANVYAQRVSDLDQIQKKENSDFFLEASLNIVDSENYTKRLTPFATKAFYSKKDKNKVLIFKLDETGTKIASIEDPNNHFSEDFLNKLISTTNSMAAGCGCAFWDLWCLAECALCKALSPVGEEDFC